MKILILLIINYFFLFSNNWKKIDVEDVGIAKKIICIDTNTCYLLSSTSLFKTTDKGGSWFKMLNLSGGFGNSISCPTPNSIFIGIDKGKIIFSLDSGRTFKEKFVKDLSNIKHLEMLNINDGIINGVCFSTNIFDNYTINVLEKEEVIYVPEHPIRLNDSLVIYITTNYFRFHDGSSNFVNFSLYKLNFYTFEYELIVFNHRLTIQDFDILNDSLFFITGKSRNIQGGTGHDAVFKSTDAGKSWRQDLDFRPTDEKMPGVNYWGLQKIAFKNDSVGIAVGQFGKILYTYDSGESWIYEKILPPYLGGGESNPPTLIIEYAGDTPIIGAFNGTIHIMTEDTYAPKPEDTLTISGRVTLNGNGLEGIAISLNTYRITMTDENGFYRFRKLPTGKHIVKAINKYVDYGPNIENFYTPFLFSSEYNINLTSDTTNIDFDATDNRNFYSLSGSVTLDNKGLEDIVMQFGSNTVTTNEDGYFIFDSVEQWRHNLTPITEGYTYEPEFYDITLNEHFTSMNFVASPITSVKSNPNFEFKNNILYSKEIVGHTYRLIDLQGRVIKSNNLSPTIDFNYLDNGTYILQVTKNNSEVFSEKFQVVR